jgi:hypothetical protein
LAGGFAGGFAGADAWLAGSGTATDSTASRNTSAAATPRS